MTVLDQPGLVRRASTVTVRALAVLLVVGAGLFTIGAAAERSAHHETAAATSTDSPAASEAGESTGHVDAPAVVETTGAQAESGEKVLGVNPESAGLVGVAIAVLLLLAGAVLWRPTRPVLLVVIAVTVVFTVLDVAEVKHQIRASRPGIAALAIAVAVVHIAAGALANHLARSSATGQHAAT